MKIRQLVIKNFRGIRQACFTLGQHNLLVGPNNIGKTTILAALNMVFGRERMRPPLTEYDFYNKEFIPSGADDLRQIEIRAVVSDFDNGTQKGPERRQFWQLDAGRVLAWDVKAERLVEEAPDEVTRLAATELAFFARYDPDLGEFVSVRVFPNPNEDPFAEVHFPVRNEHLRAIGLFFLPTARLWENALRFTSSTFRRLMGEYEARPGDLIRSMSETLEDFEPKAQSAPSLQSLVDGMTSLMERFVPLAGGEATNPGFELTRLTMEDIERNLIFFLQSSKQGRRLPISCQGSGLISLQSLVMLLKFGEFRIHKNQSFILVVEEPELHLYPHLQRQLVAEAQKHATQTIFTTHSPALSEQFSPEDILVLQEGRKPGEIVSRKFTTSRPSPDQKNIIRRLFFRQRREVTESLMGRLTVIVEGVTERYILPKLSNLSEGPDSFDLLGISVVDGEGSSVPAVAKQLIVLVETIAILIDGDAGGDGICAELLKSAELKTATIIALPAGWRIERLLTEGLGSDLAQQAKQMIERTGFAKKKGYPDLCAALTDNKGNLAAIDAYLDSLRDAKKVPPAFASLHGGFAALVNNGDLNTVGGFNREGDGVWRLVPK